jgi:hypothetical protein
MAATTTQRPPALPNPTPAAVKAPAGAAKMSRTYLDAKGLPQKSVTPVPVDQDDRRTAHQLMQCPATRVVNGGGKERCGEKQWLLPDAPAPFCPQHGKQLESTEQGPSATEQLVRAALAMHGRSALPWAAPAAAAVADVMLHLADVTALEASLSAPVLAAGTFVVAKRSLTSRAIKRRNIEKGQKTGRRVEALRRQVRRYAWYGGEAGLWAAALAGTDITHLPGVVVAGLGMTRWAFACRDWWKSADARRTRGAEVTVSTPAGAPVAPTSAPDPVRLRAVTTWVTLIGCRRARSPAPNWSSSPAYRTVRSAPRTDPAAELVGEGRREGRRVDQHAGEPAVPCSAGSPPRTAAPTPTCRSTPTSRTCRSAGCGCSRTTRSPRRMWTGPSGTDWKRGVSRVGRFDDGLPMPTSGGRSWAPPTT